MVAEQSISSKGKLEQGRSPNSLLSVFVWEWKRLLASLRHWAVMGGVFLFFIAMIWFKHSWEFYYRDNSSQSIAIVGTSAVGLLFEFVNVLMLLFALFLPFLVTEAVTRDYKVRIHEVLMATPIPTWAYVCGRFLAALCNSLLLAILILIAETVMTEVLYLRHPGYPAPVIWNIMIVWAVVMLPITILLAGIGFALGTVRPRNSTAIMMGMVIGWVLLFTFGYILSANFGDLFIYWNPTSNGIFEVIDPLLTQGVQEMFKSVPVAQQAQVALQLQAALPDLSLWVLPHYGLAAFGIFLAGLAAIGFRRFRDVLN